MLHSLQKYGQLTPVVTCRIVSGEQELLDGFKRSKGRPAVGVFRTYGSSSGCESSGV